MHMYLFSVLTIWIILFKIVSFFIYTCVEIIEMGTIYLKICTCFSSCSIVIYERLLQATGKTMLLTVSQISGALANIVLDYVFIHPLNMRVSVAAGQQ